MFFYRNFTILASLFIGLVIIGMHVVMGLKSSFIIVFVTTMLTFFWNAALKELYKMDKDKEGYRFYIGLKSETQFILALFIMFLLLMIAFAPMVLQIGVRGSADNYAPTKELLEVIRF